MLKLVSATLAELQLAPRAAHLNYYINLTIGEAISLSVFTGATDFFQVKASEFVDLRREYQTYQRAWNDFPDLVPHPLGYETREGWHIMVSQGIKHVPLRLQPLLRRGSNALREDLLRYFGTGKRHAAPSNGMTHTQLFERMQTHFSDTPEGPLAAELLCRARQDKLEALHYAPQHSDFVLNNLARAGERLVIFDWEDYGRAELPGLDLCTLSMSLLMDSPSAIRALMQTRSENSALTAFVREACARCGIEFSFFLRNIPVYLLVFLYMKSNYGHVVQQRISALLHELLD